MFFIIVDNPSLFNSLINNILHSLLDFPNFCCISMVPFGVHKKFTKGIERLFMNFLKSSIRLLSKGFISSLSFDK